MNFIKGFELEFKALVKVSTFLFLERRLHPEGVLEFGARTRGLLAARCTNLALLKPIRTPLFSHSSPTPSDWTVVLGRLKQNGSNQFEVTLNVTNITMSTKDGFNVAVLRLAARPGLSDYIQPICMDNGQTFAVGVTCWVAGWSAGRGGGESRSVASPLRIQICPVRGSRRPGSDPGVSSLTVSLFLFLLQRKEFCRSSRPRWKAVGTSHRPVTASVPDSYHWSR